MAASEYQSCRMQHDSEKAWLCLKVCGCVVMQHVRSIRWCLRASTWSRHALLCLDMHHTWPSLSLLQPIGRAKRRAEHRINVGDDMHNFMLRYAMRILYYPDR